MKKIIESKPMKEKRPLNASREPVVGANRWRARRLQRSREAALNFTVGAAG
jgi:hypothetical protein